MVQNFVGFYNVALTVSLYLKRCRTSRDTLSLMVSVKRSKPGGVGTGRLKFVCGCKFVRGVGTGRLKFICGCKFVRGGHTSAKFQRWAQIHKRWSHLGQIHKWAQIR